MRIHRSQLVGADGAFDRIYRLPSELCPRYGRAVSGGEILTPHGREARKSRSRCRTSRSLMLLVQMTFHSLPSGWILDRKSTRLNSSHVASSYAVFCLQRKKDVVSTR